MATRFSGSSSPDPQAGVEEKELTLSFQRGEKGAYQAIHDRYHARVSSICRRMLGDPDDAQEAVQETFLRAYLALGRFNGRYQLGAWIARIATNVCLDALRARGRYGPTQVLEDEQALVGTERAGEGDPQDFVIRKAESRSVRRVLAGLAPMHRAAIVLRDFEGLSYAEIALALGISDAQVKALLHRARASFKRTWMSTLMALIPGRGLMRERQLQRSLREQIAEASASARPAVEIASSTGQYVSSCSTFIQQCGQVVSERIAPVVAAALVGSAVGGAAASTTSTPPRPVVVKQVVQDARPGSTAGRQMPRKVRQVTASQIGTGEEQTAAAPARSAPEPKPQPEATPPANQPPDGTAPKPPAEPAPVPEPAGFTLTFESGIAAPEEPCSCMRITAVRSQTVTGNDTSHPYVKQTVEGSASAMGSPSFGLDLTQIADNGQHQMDFSLHTAEGGYGYRGVGSLVSKAKTAWGGSVYSYEGTYSLVSRPGYAEEMPGTGSYSAVIEVSWRSSRVISSSFSLREG